MTLVGFKRTLLEILKAGREPKTGLGLKAESLLRLNCPRASAEPLTAPLNFSQSSLNCCQCPGQAEIHPKGQKFPFQISPGSCRTTREGPGCAGHTQGFNSCRERPEGSSQLGASGGFLFLSLVLCQLINQLINNSLTLTSKNTIKVLQPLQKFIPKENFLCHHLSSKHSRQSQLNHPKKSARQNSFSFKLI